MKKYLLLLLFLSATTYVYTQQKEISLEEIWQGAFSTKGMDALRSMNDGSHYTLLDLNRANATSSIVKYEYETLQPTETILASSHGLMVFLILPHTALMRMSPKFYWQQRWILFIDIPEERSTMFIISHPKDCSKDMLTKKSGRLYYHQTGIK